jgi:hypothetical protein
MSSLASTATPGRSPREIRVTSVASGRILERAPHGVLGQQEVPVLRDEHGIDDQARDRQLGDDGGHARDPAFASMPVLAASTPMSVVTARICSSTSGGGIAS